MSFLDDFDKRAESAKTNPPPPPSDAPADPDASLLDFADLIRSRRAEPAKPERGQLLRRIQSNQETFDPAKAAAEASPRPPINWHRWSILAASVAAVALFGLLLDFLATPSLPTGVASDMPINTTNSGTAATPPVRHVASEIQDDFANTKFPKPILASTAAGKEIAPTPGVGMAVDMRVTRVHGLAMVQIPGDKGWSVLRRGSLVPAGANIRVSERLDSSARFLTHNGTAISAGPGTAFVAQCPWLMLNSGAVIVDSAAHANEAMIYSQNGWVQPQPGASFSYSMLPLNTNDPSKNGAILRVARGNVQLANYNGNAGSKSLSAGDAGAFIGGKFSTPKDPALGNTQNTAWVRALEAEASADHGIGELIAKTEKANEHLPLEIVSHSVTVTCVDQVARTFVDEVFFNNTDRQLEGTFYYPLPADAAIGEFAMYVNGKRVVGEVLEQGKARQVFEYIVRQQKDPALLEWAGGNLFKMRVFPIEPHSQKRVQLGYTQILPIQNGAVTYTYPLYSEMLLKNPLNQLNIEFRVLSNAGLTSLVSTTHNCTAALDPDGRRGALGFSAKKYSPSSDFSVTYRIPVTAECVALANVHPDDADPYLMLQLAPKVDLPKPKVPQRLLVVVDGSGSAGAQNYAVATEFAATAADLSSSWDYALVRGGQFPEIINLNSAKTMVAVKPAFVTTDNDTGVAARNALAAKPPLGATDLLATFQTAAQLADGNAIQLIYVGDGIDTVNELSASALVEKIAATLAGRNIRVSTVAIGSTYDRTVMQGLANALNGTFTRVEGAADVHDSAGQVFENFYRPRLWNAQLTFNGIKLEDVRPEDLGAFAAGDSITLFARLKDLGALPANGDTSVKGSVFFTADSTDGKIDRTFPLEFTVSKSRNQFLPRLWARAQNELLAARMGSSAGATGSSRSLPVLSDAQLRQQIIDNAIKYQIMSPYTSFLVLEDEEAYKRFNIKRSMKRVDWMSGEQGNVAAQKGRASHLGRAKNEWYFDDAQRSAGGDIFELRKSMKDQSGWGEPSDEFLGLDPNVVLGDFGDLSRLGAPIGYISFDAEMPMTGEPISLASAAPFGVTNGISQSWLGELSEENVGFASSFNGDLDDSTTKSLGLDFKKEEAAAEEFVSLRDGSVSAATDDQLSLLTDIPEELFAQQGIQWNWHSSNQSYYRRSGLSRGYYPGARYSASSIFSVNTTISFAPRASVPVAVPPDQKPQELKIDNPLKPLSVYKKIATRDPQDSSARLHWVLSLQSDSEFKSALRELQPLIDKHTDYADLRLLQAELQFANGDAPAALKSIEAAEKIASTQKQTKESNAARSDRIATVLGTHAQHAPAAERFAALARSAEKPEESARLANQSAYAWKSASQPDKGTELWNELLKRWPDSADVKSGAGNWFNEQAKEKKPAAAATPDTRGFDLLRDAAFADTKFAAQYLYVLSAANRRDEVRTQGAKLLDIANKSQDVYSILGALNSIRTEVAIAEATRLLDGKLTSEQYRGILQYWSSYSIKANKPITRRLVDQLNNDSLSWQSRASASGTFVSYNVKGVSKVRGYELVKPAIKNLKTPEDFNEVLAVANVLGSNKKFSELLELSQAALDNVALDDNTRRRFIQYEFSASEGLKRTDDFRKRRLPVYFGDNATASEVDTFVLTQAMLASPNVNKSDLAADFEKRFKNSPFLPRLQSAALAEARAIKKPEDREAAIEKLAARFPASIPILQFRARALAQKGQFKDAASLLRTFMKANEQVVPAVTPHSPLPTPHSQLLPILARICAQDTDLRKQFLAEAGEHEKTQNKIWREWSEAALTCLHEAADLDAYAGALFVYSVSEPNDPEWKFRLAAALMESGKTKEGRGAFEALSDADPDNSELAFTCEKICRSQKDEAAAKKFADRAFEALAARPSKLLQFASNNYSPNPALALKAYDRLFKIPNHPFDSNAVLTAANLARDQHQTATAIDYYFMVLRDKNAYYIASALEELVRFCQEETNYNLILPRAEAFLKESAEPQQQIAAHLLLYRLKALKKDDSAAQKDLDAALALPLTPKGDVSYIAAAVMQTLQAQNRPVRFIDYALEGGGALSPADRRQLIHSSLNHLPADNADHTAVRLLRKLLEDPDGNAYDNRRQLVDRLVNLNQLDEALAVVRKMELNNNSWYLWGAWERIITAHRSKSDLARAAELALEGWLALKDDESYASQALQILSTRIDEAAKEKKLDPKLRARVREEFRALAQARFQGDANSFDSYDFFCRNPIDALGLESDIAAFEKEAAASVSPERIALAAHWEDCKERRAESIALYRKANDADPAHKIGLNEILYIQMNHTHDWPGALETLNRIKDDQSKYNDLYNRVNILGKLNRRDESRAACHELMKSPELLRNGSWTIRSLAQICESNKDFALAVEVWELAIRIMRAERRGRIDSSQAAEFFTACGRAYKQNGEETKALDCFLRGLSVIPRDDSHYKIVLDAALEHVLKGTTLEKAVATHENNVATEGGDKPHLRLAFAEAFKRANRTREMLAQLRIAADLLPKDMRLRNEVIDGYKKLGDTEKALAEYMAWAKLDPQNIELYKGWGDLYDSLSRKEDALTAWATMAEVRPREAEGYRAYAQKLVAKNMPDKAAVALRQAVKYRPTEFDIARELADSYNKLESAAAAKSKTDALWTTGEAACRQAMEDVPDDPAPWLNLGRFLSAQKRLKDAREIYERTATRDWPRFKNETVTEAQKRLKELK